MAVGYLVSSLPVTYFVTTFGLKKTFLAYSWLSTAATFLIPLSARLGFIPLLVNRTLQGVGMPSIWSVIGAVSELWAPVAVAGTYILLLSMPFQVYTTVN